MGLAGRGKRVNGRRVRAVSDWGGRRLSGVGGRLVPSVEGFVKNRAMNLTARESKQ